VNHSGHVEYTATGMPNRKLAIWLFLASECMFFGALIATYLIYQGQSLVGPYPEDLFDIPLTTVSTFILLMSSLAMVLAVAAAQKEDLKQTRLWLAVTALMGLTFLGFQAYEYNHFIHAGLTLSVNLFGSTFYVMTGFHGAHVAIGVIWLSSLFAHTFRPVDPKRRALDIEIAGLYWHFVDIVWIVIFTVVYLLGVGG
jgi:Heme/copper-type cytochrome/quinol oxidase, subunit 3